MRQISKMRGIAICAVAVLICALCSVAFLGVEQGRGSTAQGYSSAALQAGGPPAVWDPVVEETSVSVSNVTLFHDNKVEIGFKITFSGEVRSYGVLASTELGDSDWFRDGFEFNGKTMRSICEYGDANGCRVRAVMESEDSLTIWMNKTIPMSEGGLVRKENGEFYLDSLGNVAGDGNKLLIKKNLQFPNGATLHEEADLVYEYYKGSWAYRYTGDVSDIEWEEVDILGIGNPVLYAGDKIQYEITFSANVATKQYIHMNAGSDWLLATGAGGLTAEEIGKMDAYGMLDSILDKIEITVNGEMKTVRGWQDADPNYANWSACVLNIHYNQQSGLNTMQILWCGKRIPEGGTTDSAEQPLCPNVDAEIAITFKEGFRTPAFQELKEDITYVYSGKPGAMFERQASQKTYDTITFTQVLYNGKDIAPNGRFELPSGTDKFDESLFTVLFEEGDDISYTFKNISGLKAGDNKVTIIATSGATQQVFTFTAVCQGKKGCGSEIRFYDFAWMGIALLVVVGILTVSARKRSNDQ